MRGGVRRDQEKTTLGYDNQAASPPAVFLDTTVPAGRPRGGGAWGIQTGRGVGSVNGKPRRLGVAGFHRVLVADFESLLGTESS